MICSFRAPYVSVQLDSLDRQGKILATVGEPGRYGFVALSPDGTRAAVNRTDPQTGNQDIWLVDLSQGTITRFTFDPAIDTFPAWSPDGSRIAFLSYRGGANGIYLKAVSGAASEELVFKSSQNSALSQWSPDGRFLLIGMADGRMRTDLWVLPLNGDRTPFTFLRTPFDEVAGSLSPDGRWYAYNSNESGRLESYVQPFNPSPDAGTAAAAGKWMVSRGGAASHGMWRENGKELLYLAPDGKMMAVAISINQAFQQGLPLAQGSM